MSVNQSLNFEEFRIQEWYESNKCLKNNLIWNAMR